METLTKDFLTSDNFILYSTFKIIKKDYIFIYDCLIEPYLTHRL